VKQSDLALKQQDDEVERARLLLRPSPVRSNHEPRWFTQAIQAARRAVHAKLVVRVHEIDPTVRIPKFVAGDGRRWGYIHVGLWCLIEQLVEEASSIDAWVEWWTSHNVLSSEPLRRTEVRWFDHAGSTTWGKGRAWVSEPYPHAVTAENLRQIEIIADLAKLHCGVVANSWHYPGHTVRIVFWEKDDGSN